MQKIDLSKEWKIRGEFLNIGPERFMEVLGRKEGKFEVIQNKLKVFPAKKGWMKANLPCDVLDALIKEDIVKEPLVATNSKECCWVKELSWWFVKEFEITEELMEHERVYLHFGLLDFKAEILINGIPAAKHGNVFRAFRADVKRYLKVGSNQLIIRLTSGTEDYADVDDLSYYASIVEAGIQPQRVHIRKPQYVYGWDWCMPVPTCGIGADAYLEGAGGAVVEHIHVSTVLAKKNRAQLSIMAEITNLALISADDAIFQIAIEYKGKTIWSDEKTMYLQAGRNFYRTDVTIENPHLWWPNGYGKQPLYVVKASVICRSVLNRSKEIIFGVRTLEINQDRIQEKERKFELQVNGVAVFCKGGNWVPCDNIYLRITKEKYEKLIEEAAACNFNMLRIWGGGLYEPDIFYEKCSQLGILLLHDFMYSCAFYPDNKPEFYHECILETEYQTRRLSNYPCMAVWSGNNEIQWSSVNWYGEEARPDILQGERIFHYLQPTVIYHNCPEIPYIPSSPFGGDKPDSLDAGDTHLWRFLLEDEETMMDIGNYFDMSYWDKLTMKFLSEYGFQGAARKSTLERYHDGNPVEKGGEIWMHHGEADWKRPFVDGALQNMMTGNKKLTVDEYLLYDGTLQGLLYRELTNVCQTNVNCAGDLIWMYNDCWPEMGWSVIDYYLTRKISYYFQKRSFAHQQFIVKQRNGTAEVTAINTTPEELRVTVEYGCVTFAGEYKDIHKMNLTIPAHSRRNVLTFKVELPESEGVGFIRPADKKSLILPATGLRCNLREYNFAEPKAELIQIREDENYTEVTIRSESYIPVTYIDIDDRIKRSDDFMELLPGEKRKIRIEAVSVENIQLGFVRPIPK